MTVAGPASSPPRRGGSTTSRASGVSPGAARRKRFVIFEGSATRSLLAAFAQRPDWCDATEAECKGGGSGTPSPSYERAASGYLTIDDANARNLSCNDAMARASVHFCWRHLSPKQPDVSSLVVNRWPGSQLLTEKDRMLRTLLAYHEALGLDPFRTDGDGALLPLSFELPSLCNERRPLDEVAAWRPFAAAHAAAAARSALRSCRIAVPWAAAAAAAEDAAGEAEVEAEEEEEEEVIVVVVVALALAAARVAWPMASCARQTACTCSAHARDRRLCRWPVSSAAPPLPPPVPIDVPRARGTTTDGEEVPPRFAAASSASCTPVAARVAPITRNASSWAEEPPAAVTTEATRPPHCISAASHSVAAQATRSGPASAAAGGEGGDDGSTVVFERLARGDANQSVWPGTSTTAFSASSWSARARQLSCSNTPAISLASDDTHAHEAVSGGARLPACLSSWAQRKAALSARSVSIECSG